MSEEKRCTWCGCHERIQNVISDVGWIEVINPPKGWNDVFLYPFGFGPAQDATLFSDEEVHAGAYVGTLDRMYSSAQIKTTHLDQDDTNHDPHNVILLCRWCRKSHNDQPGMKRRRALIDLENAGQSTLFGSIREVTL